MKLMKTAVSLFMFALAATALGQEKVADVVEETIRSVITQVNGLELALYKAPNDEALMEKFQTLVERGNQKEVDVRERVERARNRKAHVKPETARHVVRVTKVLVTGVRGETATVQTVETSHWEWTHGPVFDQNERLHTYHLKKFGTNWKVVAEEF